MGDKGYMVVEMSLIAPVLLGVVFVVIHFALLLMNRGIVTGKLYSTLYSQNITDKDEELPCNMERSVEGYLVESLTCAGSVTVSGYWEESPNYIADVTANTLCIKADYVHDSVGTGLVIAEGKREQTQILKRIIPDVGFNLRRWQVYGELLSK